jgi:hypothetical protein
MANNVFRVDRSDPSKKDSLTELEFASRQMIKKNVAFKIIKISFIC